MPTLLCPSTTHARTHRSTYTPAHSHALVPSSWWQSCCFAPDGATLDVLLLHPCPPRVSSASALHSGHSPPRPHPTQATPHSGHSPLRPLSPLALNAQLPLGHPSPSPRRARRATCPATFPGLELPPPRSPHPRTAGPRAPLIGRSARSPRSLTSPTPLQLLSLLFLLLDLLFPMSAANINIDGPTVRTFQYSADPPDDAAAYMPGMTSM